MTPEIRELDIEESIAVLRFLSSYAFSPTPPLPEFDAYAEKVRNRKGARYYTVFFDGEHRAISCATTPLSQNLRGQFFKMAGVANVATHPAARRKGYVRSLMHHMFSAFKDEAYAVSCLYPFKESFYERLGYVTLPQVKKITLDPKNLASVLKIDLDGSFEMCSYREGYAEYQAYLEKYQRETHGMSLFTIPNSQEAQEHEAWLAFARNNGNVIGLIQYKLSDQSLNQTMNAFDFLFSNAQGKFMLLNWIARHIDQVGKVILRLKPGQFGETLFTDIQPEYSKFFVAPMARIVNIRELAGLPAGPGEITINVSDPDCGWNTGVWQLSSDEGRLSVKPGQQADCNLTIQGLTALVYGVYDPDEFSLRGWGDPNPDQQTTLRQMFPQAVPYLHTMY